MIDVSVVDMAGWCTACLLCGNSILHFAFCHMLQLAWCTFLDDAMQLCVYHGMQCYECTIQSKLLIVKSVFS
jgi:hypothetical protein